MLPPDEPRQTSQFFRVRFVLDMTAEAVLHPFQGPTLYALAAAAYGAAAGLDPLAPDNILLDAPEQCRVRLRPRDRFAFGATLIAQDDAEAGALLNTLRRGLALVGQSPARPRTALGGNFTVSAVEDLVAGRPLSSNELPRPISAAHVTAETATLSACDRLTLHFVTPLRMHRPAELQCESHSFFDRRAFPVQVFLRRLRGRLALLGAALPHLDDSDLAQAVIIQRNSLVWLDMSYGPRGQRKSLGGAVGHVEVAILDARIVPLLVWGQYSRIGESTRFALGAYRIVELGPDPFACTRARGLLDLAFSNPGLMPSGKNPDSPDTSPDEWRDAVQAILSSEFAPHPHNRIQIPREDGDFRELAVPSARDRALQRLLLATIDPGLDAFFECSSFAYRRGLGRYRAAIALRDAFRRGYRHALRADFRRYFDSIDHVELQARLAAYLADQPTVNLIMQWVRAGAPSPGRGIPTGAPLSPLLGNLFLDEFDERIARSGGHLVRYADDFLILFQEAAQAQAVLQSAEQAAQDLLLALNQEKTAALDLREPFDFLGYRFHNSGRWQADRHAHMVRVEDIGWYDAAPAANGARVHLPGEQNAADETAAPLVIFGPAMGTLAFRGSELVCEYREGGPATRINLEHVREVLLLGPISLRHTAIHACAQRDINILFADTHGSIVSTLTPAADVDHPELLRAHLDAQRDEARRLSISRELLVAKVLNFAALARSCPGRREAADLAAELEATAEGMRTAAALDALLGLEGSAAARWYGALPERLPARFPFRRRVAPRATDPVNILLNIAYTALYYQAALALRLVGLAPALGVLHTPRPGHLALASDLMEPFRHLMERVVIEAAHELKPGQFRPDPTGRYALRIVPDAARRFNAHIYEALEQPVSARGQVAARPYRLQLVAQARRLRRHLLDPNQPFAAFQHYPLGPPA